MLAIIAAAAAVLATDQPQVVARGQEIASQTCSRCHAIGLAGPSLNPDAPPFRELAYRNPVSGLIEAAARGEVPTHGGMPRFSLPPSDGQALAAYVRSVQKR